MLCLEAVKQRLMSECTHPHKNIRPSYNKENFQSEDGSGRMTSGFESYCFPFVNITEGYSMASYQSEYSNNLVTRQECESLIADLNAIKVIVPWYLKCSKLA